MKRAIVTFVTGILIAFGSILFLNCMQGKRYSFRPDGYVFGSSGAVEIRELTKKEGDFSIFCNSSDDFNVSGFSGVNTRADVIKHINQLSSKRLAVLTLSKVFMTESETKLTMIAKKEAGWLQNHGFDRVLIEGAYGGFVLILLHDTEYERNPQRELKNAHDIIEKSPVFINVDF